ncbi:MAG: hypothetical protein KIS96_06840 [Bauldia sp.]|nr:hypothetical protein [Bauldia sp.]
MVMGQLAGIIIAMKPGLVFAVASLAICLPAAVVAQGIDGAEALAACDGAIANVNDVYAALQQTSSGNDRAQAALAAASERLHLASVALNDTDCAGDAAGSPNCVALNATYDAARQEVLRLEPEAQGAASAYAADLVRYQAAVASANELCAPGADPAAPANAAGSQDAFLSWMWEFTVTTFNGTYSGNSERWTFNGTAIEKTGTVSCEGHAAEVEGIEPGGGGAIMVCTAQLADANGTYSWQGTGAGRTNWDGMLLKALGRGTFTDAAGRPTDSLIEALFLRPGHALF